MQTNIHPSFKDHPDIGEAETILRACVHCGFCTATCPSYQQLFDERDGPRGRIYLIKQLLETGEVSEKTQIHLDRCLGCRSCETTCPSGVKYGRLADIGRKIVEERVTRTRFALASRWLIRNIFAYPDRVAPLLKLANLFKPLLPALLSKKIPRIESLLPGAEPSQGSRKMLVLAGCVQSVATPATNQAAAKVLSHFDVQLETVESAGCCGALSYHLNADEEAQQYIKTNIDAWWPAISDGVEAILVTASGCGLMVKEYAAIMAHDRQYASKARLISDLAKDPAEIIAAENLESLPLRPDKLKIAVHCPCTLQHGQKLPDTIPQILTTLGFDQVDTREKHLCCGSAGSYSLLHPKLATDLRDRKLAALGEEDPDLILTANIGCQIHLASGSDVPVRHWIEFLAEALD